MAKLNINNTQVAFASLSDTELRKTFWLFKALGFAPLSQFGPPLASLALKLKLPVRPLIEKTIFQQFCGGESITDCEATIARLAENKIGTILDYASEGFHSEQDFDRTVEETLANIRSAQNRRDIPFCVFKPTGIAALDLMAKVSLGAKLSAGETKAINLARARFEKLAKTAAELRVKLLVDAEESWIQPYVDEITESMMGKYNTNGAIIFATVQMYRRDRLDYLKSLGGKARKASFVAGIKLVRGAYLEKETARAVRLGVSNPVFSHKAETDAAFDNAIRHIIDHIDHFSFCLGTHNEVSTQLMADLIDRAGLDRNDQRCNFAQLLGMGDHLTYNLAKAGFNVAKYVPYGKLEEVIPYLGRRAQENSSIKGQASRELFLLSQEMKRRNLC